MSYTRLEGDRSMTTANPNPKASPRPPTTCAARAPSRPSTADEVRLRTSFRGNQAQVLVGGEVDVATAPQLGRCLRALERRGLRTVLVDLREVSFLDAAGLRELLAARARLCRNGTQLVLGSPSRQVRRVLAVTRLETLLGVPGPRLQPGEGTTRWSKHA